MRSIIIVFCLVSSCALWSQQLSEVDFIRIHAEVEPIQSQKSVSGKVDCKFKVLKKTDSIFLDAIKMNVSNVVIPRGLKISTSEKKIWITGDMIAGKEYSISFDYSATPKQTLYFTADQVWTQGQGKYTSHWLPSVDDMNDKIEYDLSVIVAPNTTVIANGQYNEVSKIGDKRKWSFDMKKPMSSYLVALVIGDFKKQSFFTESGNKIELYIRPEDENKREPTYRYTKEIFEFLESEIDVDYPWQNYKQVPVRDFLYAGMENTTATVFSEAFVVDSIGFVDRNYVNVNAHELAHQWFGNLVTETSGTHHWLQEGFATYYALLAEREIFGDEYYYWKLLQTADQLQQLSDSGKGEALLNPKASSLTFYEKGAWSLHILKELIGEEAFKLGIKSYLEKYQFQNVDTEKFIAEMEAASEMSLDQWKEDWLVQSAFKAQQAYESLLKAPFIKKYFGIASLRPNEFSEKKAQLERALTFPDDYVGQEAVIQLANEPIEQTLPLYLKAFESNNVLVRQAIAFTLPDIPSEIKTYYETLLRDPSYVTVEMTLYNLWVNFPEDRAKYLDETKGIVGFQDKNIRNLWLFLALKTSNYNKSQKTTWEAELINYTSPEYSFEIREGALNYVNELQIYSPESLQNLLNACVHHNWRFRNVARKILDQVVASGKWDEELTRLKSELEDKERTFLESKI